MLSHVLRHIFATTTEVYMRSNTAAGLTLLCAADAPSYVFCNLHPSVSSTAFNNLRNIYQRNSFLQPYRPRRHDSLRPSHRRTPRRNTNTSIAGRLAFGFCGIRGRQAGSWRDLEVGRKGHGQCKGGSMASDGVVYWWRNRSENQDIKVDLKPSAISSDLP